MSALATLAQGLARLNLMLPPETQQRLLNYVALVQKWNQVYNLTAVRDADKMLTHHLLDSLAVVPHVTGAKTILDVGSGAGLPGIPLALALPDTQVTLLDSNQKKTTFLQQAVIELKLNNVEVICARVEKLQYNQIFNVVISRAFSDLPAFATLAGAHVAEGGTLLAMKGVQPLDEIARLQTGFKLSSVVPLSVPGLEAERHLIFMKKAA
jgi:16S rRNA (guanine527-N7)-methyltransferase